MPVKWNRNARQKRAAPPGLQGWEAKRERHTYTPLQRWGCATALVGQPGADFFWPPVIYLRWTTSSAPGKRHAASTHRAAGFDDVGL